MTIGSVSNVVAVENVFNLNDEETTGAVTYQGFEDVAGNWFIVKTDTTSDTSVQYATLKNNTENTAIENYTDAWDNRTSLTYGDYSEAR